ncbi:6319_t:CDS:2 [Ambispora leptoticha]|uniref:RNA polymerase II subunit B1 CTD phosphatase RPAP2 homolog n=1 Tax=Ambispora leptoticha TaxID=144679 RepID=A0A9N9FR99_9GLOM|nr:6319_t:CDS:2 [Ambispora leptoticha]
MISSNYISTLGASNNNERRKATKARAKNTTNKKKNQTSHKRELLKKSLESRKEFENLTTTWQEKLFEPVDIPLLQESTKYLQPSHYFEVVEERNAYNLCGFPICNKSPQEIEGQYRISLRARKIYDVSELRCYCSDRCLLGSRIFAAQLSVEPVYMRNFQTWIPPEVLPLDVDIRQIMKQRRQEAQASSFANRQRDYIKTLLAELPPAPPGLVIQEKITDKDDGNNSSMDTSTNPMTYIHDSVEGYRIEFSKKKNQQDKKASTIPVKPTTLVLPKEKIPSSDLNSLTNENNNSSNNKPTSESPIVDLRIVPVSQITQDEKESVNLVNKRKKQKKIVPKMSMFGKIWTALDRMTTQETRFYFHKMRDSSLVSVNMKETTNKVVASSEVIMRNNIFSEKIIESFHYLQSHLSITTSIENELLDLIRTFTIDNSSVILNDVENNRFLNYTEIFSHRRFKNLIGSMGLTIEEMDAFVRVVRVAST